MNTPNKLTLLRIILVPFFLGVLLINNIPFHYLWALLIFVAASVTDAVDGRLARKNNMITDFGKFLDPLADKVLVISTLVCLVELRLLSAALVVIIIARELLVTSIRLVAMGGGKVVAASLMGKIKTVSQMMAIVTVLGLSALSEFIAPLRQMNLSLICNLLMTVAAVFTLISGVQYLMANREYIDTHK